MAEGETNERQPDASAAERTTQTHLLHVAPYLSLARDVSALLVAVPVRPAFRTELEQSLVIAARRQAVQRMLDIEFPSIEFAPSYREMAASAVGPVMDRMDRRWLMGAAAVGVGSAFSLAGLMAAYVWRQRRRSAA